MGIVLVAYLSWFDLFRFWFPHSDDIKHIALRGGPGIHVSLEQWWSLLRTDWLHRNGRTADGALRLVVRGGFEAYRALAPVMIVVLGLALSQWLRPSRAPFARPLRWTAGLLLLPFLLCTWRAVTGDAVMWAAAAMNYLFPATLMALLGARLLDHVRGRPMSWATAALLAPLAVLTPTLHEQTSLALTAACITTVVVLGRRTTGPCWLVLAAVLVGFGLQMSAPGLWVRLSHVQEGPTGPVISIHRFALSTHAFMLHSWWPACLLTASAAAFLWQRGRAGRWTAAGLVASLAALAWATQGWAARTIPGDSATQLVPARMVLWQNAVLATFLLWALLLTLVLVQLRQVLDPGALLAWPASMAAALPILQTGILSPRAYLLPILWLLVAAAAAAASALALVRPAPRRVLTLAALAGLAVATVLWWSEARPALVENAQFVRKKVLPQFERAAAGDLDRILAPQPLPRPEYSYFNAFSFPRYTASFSLYYGIPEGVRFKTVPPEVVR